MKFVAFRVDNGVLEGMTIDHNRYTVRGQRETDLNWSALAFADSKAEAEKIAFALRYTQMQILADDVNTYVPVYGTSGYELH